MKKSVHDFSWQVCHNPDCEMYMKKGCGNIGLHAHGGINKDIHELICRKCRKTFSENKGTPYYHLKLPREKVMLVLKLLVEGNGIRGTERITGIHRDTVSKLLERVSEHLSKVNEIFLADLEANEIQFDELWTFTKKKKTRKFKDNMASNGFRVQ